MPYTEFSWNIPTAANGQSGEDLTRFFLQRIKDLSNVQRICDLGCGNGYLSSKLAELAYDVTGIDSSSTGLRIAKERYPKVTFHKSLIDGHIKDRLNLDQFDLVVSSDVIEHLYAPADLVDDARSLLKPYGQLLVGTPYHGYLKNLVLSVSGHMDSHFNPLDEGGHIKFFSVKTLSALVLKHGFDQLNFSFYGRARWLWKNMICHARKA